MRVRTWLVCLITIASLGITGGRSLAEDIKPAEIMKPTPNTADEPLAKELSLARAAAFLDAGSLWWTGEKKCGTCHTNYPYLMARPLLREVPLTAHNAVRTFFENRVAHWDDEDKAAKPRWDTEVVATASFLAFSDAQTTGKL